MMMQLPLTTQVVDLAALVVCALGWVHDGLIPWDKLIPMSHGKIKALQMVRATVALTVTLGLTVILVGEHFEHQHVQAAASTSWIYDTPNVCGYQSIPQDRSKGTFLTYDGQEEAHTDESEVAHCGECGHCSTLQDMSIMGYTKESLTRDSTDCAKRSFFGKEAVRSCMEEKVGFTSSCNDCWVDNVMCTLKSCAFTCIKSVFLKGESNNVDGSKELNACLECDEKMCGPQFIQCAGANRRRSGIISDIGRDADMEVCQEVDDSFHALLVS